MAIALVQTNTGNSGGYNNSYTIAFSSNVTAGSLLLITMTSGNTDTIASVVDSKSNSWNLIVTSANSSGARQTWLYAAYNANAGATTITVTMGSGEFVDSAAIIREYSGIATTSAFDVSSTNNDGANYDTLHDAGTTSATTQANELVVLGGGLSVSSDPTATAGAGYGNGIEVKGYDLYTYSFMSDNIVSSTGAQSGNFITVSYVEGQAYIATFKAAGGGPVVNKGAFFAVLG